MSMLNSPYVALAFLAASVILWALLLGKLYKRWFILPVAEQRQSAELQRAGVVRDAEVLACRTTGKAVGEAQPVEVTLQFDNLSGTPIRETVRLVDSRASEGRFTIGRKLRLRIDKTLSRNPVAALEGSVVDISRTRTFRAAVGWLLIAAIVVGYYIFSYQYESRGAGWRFLTFYHPLLLCPLILIFLQRFSGGGLTRYLTGGKKLLQLKYRGYRTDARLREAKQTGTYINEQPEVRFQLEYEDMKGAAHLVSYKKIVDLLEMDIVRAKTIPVFYLADEPHTIAFAVDLIGEDEEQQ